MKRIYISLFLIFGVCLYVLFTNPYPSIAISSSVPSGSPFVPAEYTITAGYHDPVYFGIFHKQHTGIDMIPVPFRKGDVVYLHATMNGIAYRSQETCAGKAVLIINAAYIVYMGHIDRFLIKNNQHIQRGDIVATMGESGTFGTCVTGAHVHYQIYRKIEGTFVIVDPSGYLN